jgi:15-cis-phytoene synthase
VMTRRRRGDHAHRTCAGIARRHARNFYVGFLALPGGQRGAIYALYAFARQVDDAVDGREPGAARGLVAEQRERLRRALAGEPDDPVTAALGRAVRRHAIPAAELEALVDGVEQDLTTSRYATWEELAAYCGLVASTIGCMCVRVFGFTDMRALEHADRLGVALQLTNILRDVREDFGYGRVYLPAEDLDRFGVDLEAALEGRDRRGWDELVHFEADRARALFASGLRVCDFIPHRAAACVRTMAGIYRALLEEIDATPRLPLERRLSLPAARKLRIAAAAWR